MSFNPGPYVFLTDIGWIGIDDLFRWLFKTEPLVPGELAACGAQFEGNGGIGGKGFKSSTEM